jgi:hypothetical protein
MQCACMTAQCPASTTTTGLAATSLSQCIGSTCAAGTYATAVRKYPPVALVSSGGDTSAPSSATVSGQAYGNGVYYMTWSSFKFGGYWQPVHVFNGILGSDAGGHWIESAYGSNGIYVLSSFLVSGYNGDWIRLKLPEQIFLSYVQVYQRSGYDSDRPTDYRVYGTNDGTNWVLLISESNALYTDSKHLSVSAIITGNKYNEFGFVVNRVGQNPNSEWMNFAELQFYGATTCISCSAGMYSAATGATSAATCLNCSAGTYSSTVGESSPGSGIVAWYQFGMSSTNVLLDSSGNGYTLKNINNVQADSADVKIGDRNAVFSGSNYFEIDQTGVFSPSELTITCWCKIVQKSGFSTIASVRDSTVSNGWMIYVYNNNLGIPTISGGTWTEGYVYTNFAAPTPVWRHLAITLKQATSEHKLFIDGALYGTYTRSYGRALNMNLRIGAGQNEIVPGYFMSSGSRMSDFRLYNRALSDAEILKIFNYSPVDCSFCQAGKFSGSVGATSSATCAACPSGMTTLLAAANTSSQCVPEYSQWLVSQNASDAFGKIPLTVSTGTPACTTNSGPFPSTWSCDNPAYVYAPFPLPNPNVLDIRTRSMTWSMWVNRKNNNVDNIQNVLLQWYSDNSCNKLMVSIYNNVLTWGKACATGSDYSMSTKDVWVHLAGALVNKEGAANEDYILYANGNQVAMTSGAGPQPSWPEFLKFEIGGQSVVPQVRLFDARFWYQRALTVTQIRRQMCYNGNYWNSSACQACPTSTTSTASGAAYSSECTCAAGSYRDSTLLQNLIAWYQFGAATSDLVVDSSGNGWTLRNINNVQADAVDFKAADGSALFSGSSYFEVDQTGAFAPPELTVTCWCKTVQKSGFVAIMSTRGSNGVTIYVQDNNLVIYTSSKGETNYGVALFSSFSTATPSWRHLAMTLKQSGGLMRVFIDGVVVGSWTRSYGSGTGVSLRIGSGDNGGPPNYLLPSGSRLSDLRIYNRILSDAEILKIFTYAPHDCSTCPAGKFSSSVGATSSATCANCVAGTYSSAGASACTSCPAGAFSSTVGATSNATCTSCPPGTFSSAVGATSIATCTVCPAGRFSTAGVSTCTSCSAGKYLTNASGGSDAASCTAVSLHSRV